MPMQREKNEGDPALAAGEIALANEVVAVLDRDTPREINSRSHQGFSKEAATWPQASAPILAAEGRHAESDQLSMWVRAQRGVG